MPRVIVTETAADGLERCRLFLAGKNAKAAENAGQTIASQFALLNSNPQLGRPLSDLADCRELIIPFGKSGYVALYHYDLRLDLVSILAFRHQKEAGY